MGTKRTRPGKHVLLFLACTTMLFLASSACLSPSRSGHEPETRTVDETTLSVGEPPSSETAIAQPAEESRDEIQQHLTAARLALAAGNYAAAFIEIELASRKAPLPMAPEALFLSGLFYAAPENPTGDLEKAHDTILRMEQEYPESEWVGEGRVISGLMKKLQATESENQRLNREVVELNKKLTAERRSVQSLKSLLKKMKEIDLGIQPEE